MSQREKNLALNRASHLVLPQKGHDLLIGTLLGDGSLASNLTGTAWSSRCLHSTKQQEYLEHKYELFRDWYLTSPTHQTFKGSGKLSKGSILIPEDSTLLLIMETFFTHKF